MFLQGIDEATIDQMMQNVIDNENPEEMIALNKNFLTAIKIIANRYNVRRIALFVLSLNTPLMMRKWYNKRWQAIEDGLKKDGISIVLIEAMGNQIKWADDGQKKVVEGLIDHVKNGNKKDFIPSGTIMLADNRETKARANEGVTAVNIEGGAFSKEYLLFACDIAELSKELKKHGYPLEKIPEYTDMVVSYCALIDKRESILKSFRYNLSKIPSEKFAEIDAFSYKFRNSYNLVVEWLKKNNA